MSGPVRWGILGTGTVASEFACGLRFLRESRLCAVASRTGARAEAFAREFQAARSYSNLNHFLADSEIDVVYIATPANEHKNHSLACIHAGKSILCEKPFAMNAAEAQAIVTAARAHRVFCM